MKHTKEVSIPAHTTQVFDSIECDLCGKKTNNPRRWGFDKYDEFSVNEIIIRQEIGCEYPDFRKIAVLTVDMCPKCFVHKLLPWLHQQGVKPRIENLESY